METESSKENQPWRLQRPVQVRAQIPHHQRWREVCQDLQHRPVSPATPKLCHNEPGSLWPLRGAAGSGELLAPLLLAVRYLQKQEGKINQPDNKWCPGTTPGISLQLQRKLAALCPASPGSDSSSLQRDPAAFPLTHPLALRLRKSRGRPRGGQDSAKPNKSSVSKPGSCC